MNKDTEWNSGDAHELREYLQRHPKFLIELERAMPKFEREHAATSGAEIEGANKIIRRLKEMRDTEATEPAKAPYVE